MRNKILSIIIPVYNAEQYLEECLDSILNINRKDIEIIIINDGSKDNSAEILKKYENEKMISIIHKENEGVAVARNMGIEKARGQYITFVDADDLIIHENVDAWLDDLEKNEAVDIVIYNYDDINERSESIKHIDMVSDIHSIVDIEKAFVLGYYFNTCWGKIYRTSLIKEKKILFPTDMKIGEDMLWFGRVLSFIKTYRCYSYSIYGYRQNSNGAMSQLRLQLGQDRIAEFGREILLKESIIENNQWNDQQLGQFYQIFADNSIAKINFAIKGGNDYESLVKMTDDFVNNTVIRDLLYKAEKSNYVNCKRRLLCFVMHYKELRNIYLRIKFRKDKVERN